MKMMKFNDKWANFKEYCHKFESDTAGCLSLVFISISPPEVTLIFD